MRHVIFDLAALTLLALGAAKWISGREEAARQVVTRGQRIDVPAGILLGFQIEEPLPLRGYQRQ